MSHQRRPGTNRWDSLRDDHLERCARTAEGCPIERSDFCAAQANIAKWLEEPPFAKYRGSLLEDIEHGRWNQLDEAFYTVLEFGTGGRRGKMYPVGTNVLNERTIAESARGLADYVTRTKGLGSPRSCVIAHDTRHHSAEFAELCARVLAAAGFKVYSRQGAALHAACSPALCFIWAATRAS